MTQDKPNQTKTYGFSSWVWVAVDTAWVCALCAYRLTCDPSDPTALVGSVSLRPFYLFVEPPMSFWVGACAILGCVWGVFLLVNSIYILKPVPARIQAVPA